MKKPQPINAGSTRKTLVLLIGFTLISLIMKAIFNI